MVGNPVRKALAFFAVVTLVAAASNASALTAADGKCRAAIQKNAGKLGATTTKAIAGCWKNAMKAGLSTNCHVPAGYDTGGKVAGAATKLTDAVGGAATKCFLPDHAAS